MERKNLFCEYPDCGEDAQGFVFCGEGKSKSCEKHYGHLLNKGNVIYQIEGLSFIDSPQDALAFNERQEFKQRVIRNLEYIEGCFVTELYNALEQLKTVRGQTKTLVDTFISEAENKVKAHHQFLLAEVKALRGKLELYTYQKEATLEPEVQLLGNQMQVTPLFFRFAGSDIPSQVSAALNRSCHLSTQSLNESLLCLDPQRIGAVVSTLVAQARLQSALGLPGLADECLKYAKSLGYDPATECFVPSDGHDLQRLGCISKNDKSGFTLYSGLYNGSISVAIKEQTHATLEEANLTLKEAISQCQLDHPNIGKTFDCFLEASDDGKNLKTVFVVELFQNDLQQDINARHAEREYWKERDLVCVLSSVACGLAYAQTKGIAHRNICPGNIFVSSEWLVRLANFSASYKSPPEGEAWINYLYLAPEFKEAGRSEAIDPFKADVYSLGITILHMGILEPPWKLIEFWRNDEALSELQASESLKALLRSMLALRPLSRPSFEEIQKRCEEIRFEATDSGQCCCVCRESVEAQEWRKNLPPKYKQLESLLDQVCTVKCLDRLAAGFGTEGQTFCLKCDAIVSVHSSHSCVLLLCGHLFCGVDCFLQFLQPTRDVYDCPKCRQAVPVPHIRKVLRDFEQESEWAAVSCHICCVNRQVTVWGDCKHYVCSDCDFSLFERIIRYPRCRVCYEAKQRSQSS